MKLRTFIRYLWSTRQLAQAVGRHELPEHDQFALVLFGQILLFVSGYGTAISGAVLDWVSSVEIGLLFLITVIGTVLAYRANGSAQGREFIRRFARLSIPLVLKFSLLLWPVFYALSWLLTLYVERERQHVRFLAERLGALLECRVDGDLLLAPSPMGRSCCEGCQIDEEAQWWFPTSPPR